MPGSLRPGHFCVLQLPGAHRPAARALPKGNRMVELRKITRKNFWDVVELKVGENQKDYVTSNAVSIAQARVQPECIPLAIYAGDTPVGFVMWCVDEDDGEWWLYRLMVAEAYQGKGYAQKAMELVLRRVKQDPARHRMLLGVGPKSKEAVALYQDFGFQFDGQVFGKEHIMQLCW